MSLRRRIALAAAVSVAAVAVAISVVGYVSTRSHLIGELKQELWARASPELQPSDQGRPGGGFPQQANGRDQEPFALPPGPGFGAARGYFQIVQHDGTPIIPRGESVRLPVDRRVLDIARTAHGSFFTTTTLQGVHLEVLTVGDPYDHHAIQVALPLTGVDSVLDGLLLPYGLLIGGGILLALLLGIVVSRSALSPIEGFLRRSEAVTSQLDKPSRIEETGADELRRLAATFNQTLDALERSVESQRHLVADASHELRTPMAALRSNIQIFLESEHLPADERENLQQSILAELDELSQVVADVVELARGSAVTAHAEPVELDALAADAVERARRRAPGLRFEVELEPTVVEGVPDRVARAVTNVIDNARKWSPPDATVEVHVRDGTLTVRDHGPGFAEDDLPYVFDRFYRAKDARRLPGSGLGLAIVKQTAEAHGGNAEASNAAGGGAVLRVSFGPRRGAPAGIVGPER
jgi:two-component system, OmpR family, sensor histidine kinase MprB